MDLLDKIRSGATYVDPYVYTDTPDAELCQGDIIRLSGQLRMRFNAYYPGLKKKKESEISYLMVLTQSCDLVPRASSDPTQPALPKALHISVCPVRPIESALTYDFREGKKQKFAGHYLLTSAQYSALEDEVAKLVNNAETKHLFFLPKADPLESNSVAILSLGYAFRRTIYPELIKNRVLSLKEEFRAKVGMILASYYGRVATGDLFEKYSAEGLNKVASNIIRRAKIVDADSGTIIENIIRGKPKSLSDIENLKKQYQIREKAKVIATRKSKVIGHYKKKFFELLRDDARRTELLALDDGKLRQQIALFLNDIDDLLV